MGHGYQPLTQEERAQIAILKHDGKSNRQVARLLGRHPATIGRELKRNAGLRGYRPKAAHDKAKERARRPRYRKMTPDIAAYVEKHLRLDLSPEQISQTMAGATGVRVSHERIYQHVLEDKQRGGDLHHHLRINHKRRYRRRNRRKGDWRTKIPNRVDISLRPASVEDRSEAGHWEADLVKVGGGHLVTVVERSNRFLLLGSVPCKRADQVHAELLRLLGPYAGQVRSITYDNGPEFSRHETLNDRLGRSSYFARPYHSWERGTNENTNGLIRQYFPKSERRASIDSDKVSFVQDRLNRRPRKTLGWRSPLDVFQASSAHGRTVALET